MVSLSTFLVPLPPPSVMVPSRLRLEAERFKQGNYVFVQRLLRVLFVPRRRQDRCFIVTLPAVAFCFFLRCVDNLPKRYHRVVLITLNIYDNFDKSHHPSIGSTWFYHSSTLISMSDDEADYLSDKFLAQLEAASKPQQPKSYAERRKQALKQSHLLNEQNRKKSRKQMELEAREEGLQTSLIQKAQEEAKESGKQNKALAIMMKMGFKPGQSLGESHEESSSSSSIGGNPESAQTMRTPGELETETGRQALPPEPRSSAFVAYKHRAEPLPIKEWSGKPRSPSPMTRLTLTCIIYFLTPVSRTFIYPCPQVRMESEV